MNRIYYTDLAERDIAAIIRFISRDKPGAARRMRATLRQACERLAEFPELGERHPEVRIPGCRLFSVGDYVIFYQQVSDGVALARVLHGSQNWQR